MRWCSVASRFFHTSPIERREQRMRGRPRRGFSFVEALVGVVAGALLLGLAYGIMSAGSRLQARAGSKLAATDDAEFVFRKLSKDLAAAIEAPRLEADGLVIKTAHAEAITWRFTTVGRAAAVERRDGADRARHLVGALVGFGVKQRGTGPRTAIAVALTARNTHDADAIVYSETFYLHHEKADRDWNPL